MWRLVSTEQDDKVHRRVASLIEVRTLKHILTQVFADLIRYHDKEYEEDAFLQVCGLHACVHACMRACASCCVVRSSHVGGDVLQKYVSHEERTSKSEFESGDSSVVRYLCDVALQCVLCTQWGG